MSTVSNTFTDKQIQFKTGLSTKISVALSMLMMTGSRTIIKTFLKMHVLFCLEDKLHFEGKRRKKKVLSHTFTIPQNRCVLYQIPSLFRPVSSQLHATRYAVL